MELDFDKMTPGVDKLTCSPEALLSELEQKSADDDEELGLVALLGDECIPESGSVTAEGGDSVEWISSHQLLPLPDFTETFVPFLPRRCGQDIQRLSVVTSLPHLLKDNRDECLRRVIPKIKEFLPIAQCDMQLAASSVFLQIFQSSIVTSPIFAQHFLPIILNGLDNKDGEVGEAWLDTLLEVIPMLSKDVLRREVMTKAMQKGQLPQNVQSRLMSCRILGKISICLESFVIKKDILPLVQSLCQDVEYEVRACMCRQLDLVAKGLGLESTKGAILTELVELANDEECTVRLAGLDAVVSILFLLDDETCANTIIPLVVKFCQGALQVEDSSLPVVSRHLGKLCHGLSPNMTLSQRSWFVDYYRKLCAMGRTDAYHSNDINDNHNSKPVNSSEEERTVECRVNAAFNFPAMALFVGSPTKFESELANSFSRLCKDPCVSVRRTMAHGFHEVSRCMGSHVSLLLKDLIILFKDDYCQVLNGLVTNLPDTIESLSKVINPDRNSNSADLVAALVSCEEVIFASNDWRLQEQFVESLSSLTKLLTSDQIYQKLVPRVFNKLHNAKALPVRLAAAKTVLNYMKCNKKLEQRRSLCQRIITEFGQGKSFRSRTLFIDICKQVLIVFSKAFFKEHFYESILELSSDPIPNIRLRLCLVMPSLKHTIKLPMDRNLLQQLESHVRKLLINERDRDVLAQLKITVDELDRTSCVHDSMHSRRNITDEDLADQQKEEEERLLIELEEREKKEDESDGAATGGATSSKKKGDKKSTSLSSPLTTKSASSKAALDKKQPAASSSKGSKIPLPPGGKEPRRHSQHNMKTTSNSPAVNGVRSGSAGPVRLAATSAGRGVKAATSTRTVNSPNSAGSNSNVSSAGSSRGIGRSTGPIGSPLTSGIRRRADTNPENPKQDNIPTLSSIRRTSRDTVNRKQSQT